MLKVALVLQCCFTLSLLLAPGASVQILNTCYVINIMQEQSEEQRVLRDALNITINGIANGMRNSG